MGNGPIPDEGRLRCLEAMGVTVWARRGTPDVYRGHGAFEDVQATSTPTEPGDGSVSPRCGEVADAPTRLARQKLASLALEVSSCTACVLHQTRTRTVFGTGAPDAHCMVIGEAPGADEDRRGEPFVGRAGRLLNAMLLAIDLPRESVYIANMLKCRPPVNRDPKSEEMACCSRFLRGQIETVAPRLIVAVGRIAAQSLLGSTLPLARLRGSVHRHPDTGTPVLVTYHPAFLLRSPAEKSKAWEDLKRVRALLGEQG